MLAADQSGSLAHARRTVTGTGAKIHPEIKRHAAETDVDLLTKVMPARSQEGCNIGIAGREACIDGLKVGRHEYCFPFSPAPSSAGMILEQSSGAIQHGSGALAKYRLSPPCKCLLLDERTSII
jgi:hypothetical protein